MNTLLSRLAWLMCTLFPTAALAVDSTLERLLSQPAPPPGVVFEMAERDPRALEQGLPWVKEAARRLRERFPGLSMALVTHGNEMFALQSREAERHAASHQLVKSLKQDDGIPVHVCETYAGWRGIAPEAFPEYVDVAPSGPAQVNNYLFLDYVRVIVPRASTLRNLR